MEANIPNTFLNLKVSLVILDLTQRALVMYRIEKQYTDGTLAFHSLKLTPFILFTEVSSTLLVFGTMRLYVNGKIRGIL